MQLTIEDGAFLDALPEHVDMTTLARLSGEGQRRPRPGFCVGRSGRSLRSLRAALCPRLAVGLASLGARCARGARGARPIPGARSTWCKLACRV